MIDPEDRPAQHALWGGRFGGNSHGALVELNESLSVDLRLWPYDVRSAKAWVVGLAAANVITDDEKRMLRDGLDRVANRLADGAGVGAEDEDVHTLVERLLYEEVGGVAGKLNTGRSRNDQVATDVRLWCRDAVEAIDAATVGLGAALVEQASRGIDLVMPGYTHGQRAQPVRWAYVLLSHAWPLVRDRQRLADVARRMSELPLGAAALAGSGVAIDRRLLKEELEFETMARNGLDATGARDHIAEFTFAVTLLMTHVSRLAGELFTYATSEYGFLRLSDSFCTGSSLLPQKRNPDVLELARAKPARLLGDLGGIMSLLRGLPAGYSKDLQEDKRFLFDAVDTALVTLPAMRGAVQGMKPDGERMGRALDATMFATDVADRLAEQGVPFRDAHSMTGQVVRMAEEMSVSITEVPDSATSEVHPSLPGILASVGDWVESIERRTTEGGSSRVSVERQIADLTENFSSAGA